MTPEDRPIAAPVFVVTASETRRERFLAHLADHRAGNLGVEWPSRVTFVPGITPTDAAFAEHAGDDWRHSPHGARTTDAELCCTISHLRALRAFVEETSAELAVVAEDDTAFHLAFDAVLEAFLSREGGAPRWGVASLGYFRPSAVQRHWWDPRFEAAGTRWTVRRRCPLGKPWGTVGYLITRAWAGQLLARYDRRPVTALAEHRLAWDFLFFDPKRVALIPPLIVEDYRCQSLMARPDSRPPERDPALRYREYLIT